MAYVGKVSIRTNGHMENAIDYIGKEDKALSLDEFKKLLQERLTHLQAADVTSGDRLTCIHCSSTNTYRDFENMRKAFGQDKGVIAHHYYQSFSPEDQLTPEQAHQIGVELAKRMFPDFQVVVATHTDRNHLHNHIIVNSCNITTGQKWYSNKKSLSDIRAESDRLCLQHGLSVIDKHSRYKGIDRTTYTLATQGKSWKVQLVNDLTEAVRSCHSKEQFIAFMEKKGYSVRYRDVHITIRKEGEKKGIRVDTLAKQFGEKFTKENLEKAMGYYEPLSPELTEKFTPKKKADADKPEQKSNWEHYEQQIFRQLGCLQSSPTKIVYHKESEKILHQLEGAAPEKKKRLNQLVFRFLFYMAALMNRKRHGATPKRYQSATSSPTLRPANQYITHGTISYRKLTESAGENFTIKVSLERLLQLTGQPILYAARIDRKNGNATITIKAKDKDFLTEILNLVEVKGRLVEQNERISNQMMYTKLKQAAEAAHTKLEYLVVTPEQIQALKEHYQEFACFEKEDGKFNIAFLPEKSKLIKSIVFPKPKEETEKQKNFRIYGELKQAAAETGEKLQTRSKLTSEQLEKLRKANVTFAYFTNKENAALYNISFQKKDIGTVMTVLETEQQRNSRIYAMLKQTASDNGEKLQYRTQLTSTQLQQLRSLGITFAYFKNKDNPDLYNIAFDKKDIEAVKAALTSGGMKRQ